MNLNFLVRELSSQAFYVGQLSQLGLLNIVDSHELVMLHLQLAAELFKCTEFGLGYLVLVLRFTQRKFKLHIFILKFKHTLLFL